MSWSSCGKDSKGRKIGYAHIATCDHPGCIAIIDRGLSYACGGMHGDDEVSCEGYFCAVHRPALVISGGSISCVCVGCAETLKASDGWVYDNEEDLIREKG